MTSILWKLTRPVTKCMKYRSYFDILRNQERIGMRNYTAKSTVSLTNFYSNFTEK